MWKLCLSISLFFFVSIQARTFIPHDWRVVEDRVDFGSHVVHVALKQSNVDRLPALVMDVSDPDSPNYGNHWSLDQVTDLVQPPLGAIKKVMTYLKEVAHADEIRVIQTNDVITAVVPTARLSEAFGASMAMMEHSSGRRLVRSTTGYTIPEPLVGLVDLIHGISDFPPPSRRGSSIKRNTAPLTRSAGSSNSNAPILSFAGSRGEFGKLDFSFTPICSGGDVSTTSPPCNGDFLGVETKLQSPPNAPYTFNPTGVSIYTPLSDMSCSIDSTSGNTVCSAQITTVKYAPLDFSIGTRFNSCGVGDFASWPHLIVSTAPVIPQTIASQYSIPPNTIVTHPNATQAVGEFEQQYYSPSDLAQFFDEMGIPSAPVTVVGPNDASNPGVEANLDIQYIMGVAPGSPTTFWSIKANSTAEIDHILTWAYQMSNTTNPPLVNSLSYGMTEGNVDVYLGKGYLARSDVEFMKLALRGITIIIADGDTGASDLGAPPMSAGGCDAHLHADWPSQSPYVTAISSTYLTPFAEPICYRSKGGIDCNGGQPIGEVAVSVDYGLFWTSGGGFSNTSQSPPYQSNAIQSYLANASHALPPSSMFNHKGRAYPDATAIGHNLEVVFKGQLMPVDGTSASAPVFAGVITLLNDALLNNGQPPLGFLNPMMYKLANVHPNAFYDVTIGDNRCGAVGFDPVCCPYGYRAAVGWDAVSGLGSPNYQVLRDLLVKQ